MAVDWNKVLQTAEVLTGLLGEVDPAIAAPVEVITAIEDLVGKGITTLATQKQMPIEDVIAGLTPEAPIT